MMILQFKETLGKGSGGCVFKAIYKQNGAPLAIKVSS